MKALQLGILGVSGFFKKKIAIPVGKSPIIDIAAIASRSEEKARQAAHDYGIPKAYGSYEALLQDPDIDAVYLPLPNHLHATYIKKAAEAGKHVLCEKPLTLDAEEARDSIAYASDKGIKLMEAFMYRFHPQWQHALELIRMNEIGKVQLVQVHFAYTNTDPQNIRNQAEAGGGALMDIGCYAVSVCRYLMRAEPERVICLVEKDKQFATDVLSSGLLDFGTARAEFTVSTQSFPYQTVNIFGRGGMMSLEIPFNTYSDVEVRLKVSNSIGTREVVFAPEDQYLLEFEAFAKAILEDKVVPTPPNDALHNMLVLDALKRSAETQQWVALE